MNSIMSSFQSVWNVSEVAFGRDRYEEQMQVVHRGKKVLRDGGLEVYRD